METKDRRAKELLDEDEGVESIPLNLSGTLSEDTVNGLLQDGQLHQV